MVAPAEAQDGFLECAVLVCLPARVADVRVEHDHGAAGDVRGEGGEARRGAGVEIAVDVQERDRLDQCLRVAGSVSRTSRCALSHCSVAPGPRRSSQMHPAACPATVLAGLRSCRTRRWVGPRLPISACSRRSARRARPSARAAVPAGTQSAASRGASERSEWSARAYRAHR